MRNTPSMNQDNMHCDNIRWVSENALWLKNIEEWDQEIEQARSTLQDMQHRLVSYINMYEEHRQALLQQQSMLQQQDQSLQTGNETEDTDVRQIAYHQVEADKHEKYRQVHKQMRSCHKSIISMMNGLKLIMDNNCMDQKVSEQGDKMNQ